MQVVPPIQFIIVIGMNSDHISPKRIETEIYLLSETGSKFKFGNVPMDSIGCL